MTDQEDVFLWPDGFWCFAYEIGEFSHKSDDFERLAIYSPRWIELVEAEGV